MVSVNNTKRVNAVILNKIKQVGINDYVIVKKHIQSKVQNEDYQEIFWNNNKEIVKSKFSLLGEQQIINLEVSLEVIKYIRDKRIRIESIKRGIESIKFCGHYDYT